MLQIYAPTIANHYRRGFQFEIPVRIHLDWLYLSMSCRLTPIFESTCHKEMPCPPCPGRLVLLNGREPGGGRGSGRSH